MKKRVIFFLFLVIFFTWSGCSAPAPARAENTFVVTGIQIHHRNEHASIHRSINTPEKVRLILLCLRTLGPDFPPQTDVEALSGDTFSLTLTCGSGTEITYRIKNDLYLQKNDGPWRRINREKAAGFRQFLLALPADNVGQDWAQLPATDGEKRVYWPIYRQFLRP